jgi:translation initiation factor RLI1
LQWLAFAIFERCTAKSICRVARVDHDVVRRDTTWEEVGVNENSCNGCGICFRRVGDKDCPDGKELAKLEGILAA